RSAAAIVTSGTVTRETALLEVPQIVVYKGSPLSYQIARRLIKVLYISVVNLNAGRALVPEWIQQTCTPEQVAAALDAILAPEAAQAIRAGYRELAEALLSGGGAEAAAIDMISDLSDRNPHHGQVS